jgi:hypothetical protein
MPELSELGEGGTTATAETATVTETEKKPEATGTGVVDATVVDAPAGKKKVKKVPAPASGNPTPETSTPPATTETTPATKPKKKGKKEVTGEATEKKEPEFIRPPHEMMARDVERLILDKKVAGHDIKKLPYKCGKIIFGLPAENGGKDFRVIALKARKKTKSVAGKSRCIYYFGIIEDHSAIVKEIPGTKTTNFGKCSVQCKKPIELVLDKVSFKESFNQKTEDVLAAISKLIDYTVEQKTTQYKAMQEATKEKEKAAAEKAKKKEKAEAKAD